MRRIQLGYRGTDKPPGPTLSPPPYSRHNSSRSNASSSRQSSGGNIPHLALSSVRSRGENELALMRGIVSSSAPVLDPRSKRPMMPMPSAGRTIPKLKMGDLTSSLAPLIESQMEHRHGNHSPLSLSDKRVADAMKEVTGSKDMLESFDDAIKSPDIRTINSRVLQLKKMIGPTANKSPKMSSSRLGNPLPSKVKAASSGKLNAAKVSPKNEEQNIRRLMGQLKEKYLDDMESQLGLAIERRPKKPSFNGESYDGIQDHNGNVLEVAIPRPSTNATDITYRIDKVVREWAAESQKINSATKMPVSAKQENHSVGSMNKANNTAWQKTAKNINDLQQSVDMDKRKGSSNDTEPGKNKHLAKISTAFRKSLDPFTKRDVRELIGVGEDDDHIERLEQEHEERRRAHESVFKNAVVAFPTPSSHESKGKKGNKRNDGNSSADNRHKPATSNKPMDDGESKSENVPKVKNVSKHSSTLLYKNKGKQPTKPNQTTSTGQGGLFGKTTLVNGDEDEVYKMIKEHMEYENSGGAPKLSKPSLRKPVPITRQSPSMLRSDAAGKALIKYSDSHKKLQSVVDSFTEKVDVSEKKRHGPQAASITASSDASDEGESPPERVPFKLPVSTVSSAATINSRRRNSTEVSTTLSRSMKTIGRASSVAQRLGTLMSRVALRNENYDYEKQQEEKEAQKRSISTSANDDSPSIPQHSVRTHNVSIQHEPQQRPNPYESNSPSLSNSRGEIGLRPNVSPGVSKLDSSQFGKYVEEMKKVAENAAASFEKFKERQVKNQGDLPIFSEDEDEELSDQERNFQGNGEAASVAAAAAEIAAIQEEDKKRKAQAQQRQTTQKGKNIQRSSPRKQTNSSDAGTSPRETVELFAQLNRTTESDMLNNNNNSQDPSQFKFVPDMSYTDQLMLQKLRKLKEQEGWTSSLLSKQIEAENESIVGDSPTNQGDIESIIKRATDLNMPKEPERAGMGPVSLNAILRSRLSGKK